MIIIQLSDKLTGDLSTHTRSGLFCVDFDQIYGYNHPDVLFQHLSDMIIGIFFKCHMLEKVRKFKDF